tara:strand:- start:426 stop:857 length:432 start_codon:yes stop_codon:yes gene_type:complete
LTNIGVTDRLSLLIVVVFYSATVFIGYNFINKNYKKVFSKQETNKRLVHLVLIKFKDDIKNEELQKVINGAYELQKISAVQDLNFSNNISPEGLSKGYTHSLTMKFSQAKDRDSIYLPHPIHQGFVKLFVPLTESVLVFDYWE